MAVTPSDKKADVSGTSTLDGQSLLGSDNAKWTKILSNLGY